MSNHAIPAGALAPNKGFLFKYLRSVPAASYDLIWQDIFPSTATLPSAFSKNEVSGMIMVTDDDALTKTLSYEEYDGELSRVVTLTVRVGVPLPIQARKILSAGTTALNLLVWLGQ
jgi:hypothetical protein